MSTVSPSAPPPLPADHERWRLRRIADNQRIILICILAYLGAVICRFMVPPSLQLPLMISVLALGVVAAVFLFKLATILFGTGVGVVLGILTLIPLVGLIVLLIINGQATAVLKRAGIRVGLLGANSSKI